MKVVVYKTITMSLDELFTIVESYTGLLATEQIKSMETTGLLNGKPSVTFTTKEKDKDEIHS